MKLVKMKNKNVQSFDVGLAGNQKDSNLQFKIGWDDGNNKNEQAKGEEIES